MSLNDSETNRKFVAKKRTDLNGVKNNGPSEIGYPNNKDMGEGKKGGIVGKG